MDIQHCITTKKEKDLRFLESEKRGSNENFLFFMQKKDIQICSGVLPVKRTIKNNKFLYRQPCYGWRYFMLLLCIAYDIPLVSLHVVFFEVVHCCNNLCN